MRRIARALVAAAAVCGISALAVGLVRYAQYKDFVYTPFPDRARTVFIDVPRGMAFRALAKTLADNEVVSDADSFVMMARIRGVAAKVQAGEYEFETPILPEEVLDILVRGAVRLHTLTIPEGYEAKEIARAVEEAGAGTAEEFLRWAMSPDTAAALGVDAETLEGYLFPDTYRFSRSTTTDQIVTMMVRRFHRVVDADIRDKARHKGFTLHKLITLASIVEKETGAPSERPRVASVFLNRLRIGMRLQSDPTVVYGIADFKGTIRKRDLRRATPYNTYVNYGLPPGPICSPGKASILAVLNPEETKYLYFVSMNNGTHKFSRNYREHAAAVREYQRRSE